jgi:hypothetical protein
MLCSSAAYASPDKDLKPEARLEVPDGLVLTKGPDLETTIRSLRLSVRGGEEYKCFTRDEWATMADLVIDYRWFWDYTLTLENELKLRAVEIGRLEDTSTTWREALESERSSREKMGELFEREHGLRLSLERKTRLKEYVLWGGIILTSAAAVAFGTAYAVTN